MYKAWRKREQMAPSDKTQGIKEMRDERHPLFLEALQLMSGQEVTGYTPVARVSRSRASNSCRRVFHSAFILCCNYSRGLSALWALSGGATPSPASESVLSTISPRCVHYTFKREEMIANSQMSLPLQFNSAAEKFLFFLNRWNAACL